MSSPEEKIFKSTYELEEQIMEYIFKNKEKIKLVDRKNLKESESFKACDTFKLGNLTIENSSWRWRSYRGSKITVDGASFTSAYADHYLKQLLEAVINNDSLANSPIHPPRIAQLEAILKKCK